MFNIISSKESLISKKTFKSSELIDPEGDYYASDANETSLAKAGETESIKKTISVGDHLPYGIRLHYGTHENVVRMKDIGVKKRILVLGVIGSFTPYCWNRHLFQVLQKSDYYEERDIDYICCVATNDAFTQIAWGSYLGCEETVLMFADVMARFTKAIGMDTVLPWLDNKVRSKRYLIYAEDMVVMKMIVASNDGPHIRWDCEHLLHENEDTSDSDSWDFI